ncbi:hypothetical protein PF005_g5473 [Phytophthora fragariae]|uniref:Uncharacterized protein n=1 Tax=Phytophthora fragariae TaxID=53985 RepID=A0A6A3YWU9_9STRA|nr:hypothetical protein PF009_g5998 [Phytophthora fragariae]KAE9127620.1 hypothetical protein PF007_g5541 [Phytophthora fragariae]KAE9225523.1 hypothetical protein PF005_g5473 [Phytophthora fragariae]KAE9247555.1 hypothetical protein PF002_g6205 [Phytophthora fragariae]KAE9321715.1 hypothetical protein PF001_g4753 [Phytophthora fragariae]
MGETVDSLSEKDITNLKIALESNSTCGFDMKRLLDHTWLIVAELRRLNPGISEDDIRVIMSKSNLVLRDITVATSNCMSEGLVAHVLDRVRVPRADLDSWILPALEAVRWRHQLRGRARQLAHHGHHEYPDLQPDDHELAAYAWPHSVTSVAPDPTPASDTFVQVGASHAATPRQGERETCWPSI